MKDIERQARQTVSQKRARELLEHRTRIGNVECPTIQVSDLRRHMTAKEIETVHAYWQKLPPNASFATTLMRLALPRDDPQDEPTAD